MVHTIHDSLGKDYGFKLKELAENQLKFFNSEQPGL